jgi:hypothetical protein
MFAGVNDMLAESQRLLDAWAAVDWRACDPDAVARSSAQLVRDADRLRAIALLAVAEHDRRGGIGRDGDRSTEDWLARQSKSSTATAARAARLATRMAKAPETARAAAEGTLSAEQADVLAGAVTDGNAAEFARREADLIEAAKGSLADAVDTANRFRTETGESTQGRADRLHAARRAAAWLGDDGMVHGRQALAGDAGATFRNTFQRFVDREHRRGHGDGRTNAQRRADAVVEMARFAAAALNGDTAASAPVPTVVTHIDLDDVTNGTGTGEDEASGATITGEAARRLACDAGVVRLITKGRSETIDVGRRTRAIPTATRRAVLARDGGCTYPGCHTPADWVQVHHIRHWTNLGTTDPTNLAAVCTIHHHLVHEGRWTMRLDPDSGRVLWGTPDGRTLVGQRRRRTEPSAA